VTPERWRRVEELFEAALELPEAERGAFLDHAGAGDPELRREVARLLKSERRGEGFLEGVVEGGLDLLAAGGGRLGPYRLLRRIGLRLPARG